MILEQVLLLLLLLIPRGGGAAAAAAAREVNSNHERMVANGTSLADNRFWRFVMDNGPWSLYNGYKLTLYGLVSDAGAGI
jgi:hypothetical protein